MRQDSAVSFLRTNVHYLLAMALVLVILAVMPALSLSEVQSGSTTKKPRFEHTNLVLKDNKVGLMWSLNADWTGQTFTWDDAQDYVYALNVKTFAGFRDWRVPSLRELESLVEHVKSLGLDGLSGEQSIVDGLRKLGVERVENGGYWSSTENIYNSSEAWYMNMERGTGEVGFKSLYFFIWPVRSLR